MKCLGDQPPVLLAVRVDQGDPPVTELLVLRGRLVVRLEVALLQIHPDALRVVRGRLVSQARRHTADRDWRVRAWAVGDLLLLVLCRFLLKALEKGCVRVLKQ